MSVLENEIPSGSAQIAARLADALAASGLSQSDLARQLAGQSASEQTIQARRRMLLKWLQGQHLPSSTYAIRLAMILGTPRDYFLAAIPVSPVGIDANSRAAGSDFEAIQFVRDTKAAAAAVSHRRYQLPLDRAGIAVLAKQFNPDRILVDAVSELTPGERAVGGASFHPDTWGIGYWYRGTGIVPGVLLIEVLTQLGAVVLLSQPENAGRLALCAGLERTRFRKPVKVGEQLEIECNVTQARGPVAHVVGRALSKSEPVAQCDFTLVVD